MAKNTTLVRTSGLFLLAIALLALTAFFVLSGASPVKAGTGDTTPPECLYVIPVEGELLIKVIIRDLDSGLDFLAITKTKNIGQTDLPTFVNGTNELVVVTGEVDDDGANARILVQSWDVAGNSTSCVGNYQAP